MRNSSPALLLITEYVKRFASDGAAASGKGETTTENAEEDEDEDHAMSDVSISDAEDD